MVSLTSASQFSKKSSVWFAISIAALLVLIVLFIFGKSIFTSLVPPIPLPATVAFGKIPAFNIENGIRTTAGSTFVLQTISGDLPNLPTQAKVFATREDVPSFSAADEVKKMARGAGFFEDSSQISGGIVRFTSSEKPDKTLNVDTLSGNFDLQSDYTEEVKLAQNKLIDLNTVKNTANSFFAHFNLNPAEYPTEKIKDKKYRFENSNLIEVNALAGANVIEIDYYPADLDKLPVIPAHFDKSDIYALIVGDEVVVAKMQNLKLERNKFATYPLKGVAAAFEDLKAGRGYLNLRASTNEIGIRDVKLGYVIDDSREFLQPVYLFYGFGDLIAYVPALNNNWVQ